MKNIIKGFVACVSMFSAFPVPYVKWEKPSMKYIFCFLPAIGLLIGAAELGWFLLASNIEVNAPLYGAAAAALPFIVTGGIHMDGYIDVWDAVSSRKNAEEMRDILKDPHVGAFGALHAVLYCMLLFGVFCEFYLRGGSLLFLFFSFPLSRTLGGIVSLTAAPSSKSGLLYLFSGMSDKKSVIVILTVYIIIIFAVLFFYEGIAAFFAVSAVSVAVFAWFRASIVKKFGGISGDLAGFFIQAAEPAFIAAAVFVRGFS